MPWGSRRGSRRNAWATPDHGGSFALTGLARFELMRPRMQKLTAIITATDPETRNQPLDVICAGQSLDELLSAATELDEFRRRSDNLYERVRALFFLYAI